jgi:hypothetical protein
MADRLALGEGAVAAGQGSLGPADRAGAAAVGAGLLGAQSLRLLLQQSREGAFSQPGSSGAGDLLHGGQIDLGSRAIGAEGVAGDDFAPAGGQFTDFLEVLGGEVRTRHGESCLGVAKINRETLYLALYRKALCQAKLFLASQGLLPVHSP